MGARRSEPWLLGLALAGGVVDAASYIGLGRVFTANMTGNTTYMTSTLVNAIARVVQRTRHTPSPAAGAAFPSATWATYAVGALAGAVAAQALNAAVVALPLAIVRAIAAATTVR